MFDCLIIGAGPAGLTAAIYLARYRRDIVLLSAGPSRAELIPLTHNFPGWPEGVSGGVLLARLQEQAASCGVQVRKGRVEQLQLDAGAFTATFGDDSVAAATVVLATGVLDQHPDVPKLQEATLAGVVRWCPICDGFDVLDQRIAIVAPARAGLRHALFLRTYSRNVTLLALPDSAGLDKGDLAQLQRANVELVHNPVVSFRPSDSGAEVIVLLATGAERRFDTLYPMHGCSVQARLATALGARCDEEGDLLVDEKQCTSVDGLYAVGDVVHAINQISVAIGHAAIAATAIHNRLPRNFRA